MGQLTWSIWAWACWGGAALLLGVGLSLLLLALWRDKGRHTRRCPKCWYEMTGVPGLTCPECGRAARSEKAMFRRRWRRGWSVIAVLLLVASGGLAVWPKVARDGWLSVTPTTVLIAAWPLNLPAGALTPDVTGNSPIEERLTANDLWPWQKRWLQQRARDVLRGKPGDDARDSALWVLMKTDYDWTQDHALAIWAWPRSELVAASRRPKARPSGPLAIRAAFAVNWRKEEIDACVARIARARQEGTSKDDLWSAIVWPFSVSPAEAISFTEEEKKDSFLPVGVLAALSTDTYWADMLVLSSRAVLSTPPSALVSNRARERVALIEGFAPSATGAALKLARGIRDEIDLANIRRDLVVMYVLAPWHPEAARSIGLIGPDDAWFTLWRRVILARADRNPAEVARLLAEAIRSERVDRRKLGIEMVALLLVDDPQIRAALIEAKARSGADAAAASAALEQLNAAAATPSANTPR